MDCRRDEIDSVLVIDDDDAFREDHIPMAIEEVFGDAVDIRKAGNSKEALSELLAAYRAGREPDPIVLDMHMPIGDAPEIDTEAGVKFLRMIRERFGARVIVFTAYPTLNNCVAAMRAGAVDYIPKVDDRADAPQGIQGLVESLRNLLQPEDTVPDETWNRQNLAWLQDTYGGKWVAFIPEETARECGVSGPTQGGLLLLVRDSYEELLEVLIKHDQFITEPPVTWRVAGSGGLKEEEC